MTTPRVCTQMRSAIGTQAHRRTGAGIGIYIERRSVRRAAGCDFFWAAIDNNDVMLAVAKRNRILRPYYEFSVLTHRKELPSISHAVDLFEDLHPFLVRLRRRVVILSWGSCRLRGAVG